MKNGFEPTLSEWRDWQGQITDFASGLGTDVMPESIGAQSIPGIVEEPLTGGLSQILALLHEGCAEAMGTTAAGYLAYVPGGGIKSSALAGFIGNLMNRFTGIESHAPMLISLENSVLNWLCDEFGLPTGAFGIFTSGGSIANLTALMAMRVHALGKSGDFSKAIIYVSDQVHHSVKKSAFLAGFPPENCVAIATDSAFKLSMPALAAQLKQDRANGLRPIGVVGSAGTTNTGAIDPFEDIALLCRAESLWFHVDAAYGGAFVLCEDGKKRLRGISMADSITFDPHKGMFLPYGTGCLLVKDREALLRIHTYQADYLANCDINSPASLGPELSREFRGLRLWLPLILHGAGAFRQALGEKLALTHWLDEQLRQLPIEIMAKPELSTLIFKPTGTVSSEELVKRVNAFGRVYLAPTRIRGESAVRVCILSFRTHLEQVQMCFEDIQLALKD
ncbi:MAG: pyridoxal-dependent decarboxylase [Myxococcota bacterium]